MHAPQTHIYINQPATELVYNNTLRSISSGFDMLCICNENPHATQRIWRDYFFM